MSFTTVSDRLAKALQTENWEAAWENETRCLGAQINSLG